MKFNAAAALLALILSAACASTPRHSPPPPPPEPATPTERAAEEGSRRGAWIGRIIGTVAGVVASLDGAGITAILDLGDAGEAIGAVAGAAHGVRISSEFDEQEQELLAIDGVDVARPRKDALEIRATDERLAEIAKVLARHESDVELSATTPERARAAVDVLVANGVDRGDITVRVDPYGPELVLRIR
jgi:hypothetical protein